MLKYPVRVRRDGQQFLAESPDLPIAQTVGASREECLENARKAIQDCIVLLMSERIPIPAPSRIEGEHDVVVLPALNEAKLALYELMRIEGLRKAELARRLDWHQPQIDRLLDLRHESRFSQLEQAFLALGKRISIYVHNDQAQENRGSNSVTIQGQPTP